MSNVFNGCCGRSSKDRTSVGMETLIQLHATSPTGLPFSFISLSSFLIILGRFYTQNSSSSFYISIPTSRHGVWYWGEPVRYLKYDAAMLSSFARRDKIPFLTCGLILECHSSYLTCQKRDESAGLLISLFYFFFSYWIASKFSSRTSRFLSQPKTHANSFQNESTLIVHTS